MKLFKSRAMRRHSLLSRVPTACYVLSKSLMRACLKRSLKYGQVRSRGQPGCSAGSWCNFQAQQFAAVEILPKQSLWKYP